ncbi:hypothetical protein Goklo_016329, partial [Gossypium klotzschianum]|nr:hypothetical protein [Gossypium klotzschianum]
IESLSWKKGFLDKVEDNEAVRTWSEQHSEKKGGSFTEGYVSELWDFTRISVTQNNLQELKEIQDQWSDEVKQLFYSDYGYLPYLLDMKVDKHLFRALAQFWNPAYGCFIFGKVDLVPTVEEYIALLRCSKIQVDKVYSRVVNVPTLLKKLMNITGMSEQWSSSPKPWVTLMKQSLILVDAFRSLNECRRTGKGRFVGCAQLLSAWFHGQFWKVDKVSYRVFSENYSPLKEIVPLLGIWGAVGYAPFLVVRQYRSSQFVPVTQGLAQCEFSYKGDCYKKKIRYMSNAWNQNRSEDDQPIEKHLQVVPFELEIIRQYFERRNSELKKKIEQMEEEKMNLRLDIDVQKLETEKLRKRKNKAKENLDSLKTDYKKLRLSMRTFGLGKTSEQWQKILLESLNERRELRARVAELERSLHQNRNSGKELRASLSKNEDMNRRIRRGTTKL